MTKIYVLNGPNLNLLGKREPEIYGHDTLDQIEARLEDLCGPQGCSLVFRQTNHEGELVDWIQEAAASEAGIILNAGAYTHTSLALHDAILASRAVVVEVHLSNVHARETYRHTSYISAVARGVILGFGAMSYELAFQALLSFLMLEPKKSISA